MRTVTTLSRAPVRQGVDQFVLTGSSEQGSRDALELAARYPQMMFSTAGVHPHHSSEYSDRVDATLLDLLSDERVVAVGECGLDHFRNFSPPEAQHDAFIRQLKLAERCGKPLFLHQRDAHDEFMDILAPRVADLPPAIAHCFTGDQSMLDDYLELGFVSG